MSPRKEYRSALRSRELIRTAFIDLLHEKNLERITVTDVVSRAGINRSTFYAHYPDIRGILEEYEQEILVCFQDMLSHLDFTSFFDAPEPLLRQIIAFMEEHQELFRLINRSSYARTSLPQIKAALIQQVLSSPTLPLARFSPLSISLQTHLLINGIVDTFSQWLSGDFDCTLDEIIHECRQIITVWLNA